MIELAFQPTLGRCDLVRHGGNLQTDEGLETAVLMSLLTDDRDDGAELTGGQGSDPRGWWGNAFLRQSGDALGSQLWTLARRALTAETRLQAIEYPTAALAWLTVDGLAESATVDLVSWRTDGVGLRITIKRPNELTPGWVRIWKVTLGLP